MNFWFCVIDVWERYFFFFEMQLEFRSEIGASFSLSD